MLTAIGAQLYFFGGWHDYKNVASVYTFNLDTEVSDPNWYTLPNNMTVGQSHIPVIPYNFQP